MQEKIINTLDEREKYIKQKSGRITLPLACNNDSLAGAVSQRACVYSGARVVLNPITDALHLVHGPIGCASYTWDIRGSFTSGATLYKNSFSTDMKELDVVFGGEKKLANALRELAARYNPPAVFVYSTCIIGVIGDDLGAVCKSAQDELNIPVIPVQSPGFKGTKRDGYKAACNALFQLIGTEERKTTNPYTVNLLGEYNVAGDLENIKPYFEEMGVDIIVSLTGDSRIEDIRKAHCAKLNLVQCSGSMTYLAKQLGKNYGIPFKRISFFGTDDMSTALRTTAGFFNDPAMIEKAEEIIRRETERTGHQIEEFKRRVGGKRAAIYMGGAAKAVSLVRAFRELDMEVVIIGTQTGKRDDYEQISCLVRDGTVIIDDANPLELRELLIRQNADLLVSGVKERFLAYKLGIPFCDFNHDRIITFEGFDGMVNFAEEIDTTVNSPVWNLPVRRNCCNSRKQEPKKSGSHENIPFHEKIINTGASANVEELCYS
ncbi:MAG: nitrogenase iron-molybdenum cofactor biosynthesis protein NifE [Candidatus Methanoperedenaceae archaeon]|nr:nitrogenase iron-molybdenum cofactor biosynthesis protein NifE [Candidatus Methanoperedenaceae archaeon]